MFSGNQYGTSQSAIQDVLDTGRMCVLDIEISGVQAIRQTELDPRYVFISPPSVDALENRLRLRGTETKASLLRRLAAAKREMEYGAQPGNFDITIVNDNLDNAYEELKLFVLPDMRKLEPSGILILISNPYSSPLQLFFWGGDYIVYILLLLTKSSGDISLELHGFLLQICLISSLFRHL